MHSASLLIAAALLAPHNNDMSPVMSRPVVLRVCERASHPGTQLSGEQAVLLDAADGTLDDFSLLEAALHAGEAETFSECRRLAVRFVGECDELSRRLPKTENEKEVAQLIFEALHANVLVGRYQARCSDCSVTLEHGDYNCVTATVLYVEALRRHGIQAEPYAMVGHVFCRVGEEQFDVETTCARWFRLSHSEANSAARRAAPRRGQNRAAARKLSDVQLLGKIYYNRGVACFRQNEFEQGMLLTQRSLALDPQDDVAHGNVLAGLNNWGLDLCQRKEFTLAQEKFGELRSIDPDYPTLKENEAHLYRLWDEHRLHHVHASEAQDRLPQG